jgi:TolB-like protein/DNA-binding winged helix-turn-helix (wHTH) protein
MIYHFGECTLDTQLYCVQRGGQTIRLRPKVFRMCLYLLEHRDRVVPREELCAQMWPGRFVNPATLEGVIRSVRQAVGDSGRAQGIILTRHSYGYRFVAGVEEQRAEGASSPVQLSSTLYQAPEAPGLGQTDIGAISVSLMQEPEAGPGRGAPRQHGFGVGSRMAIGLGEPRLTHQRALGVWWDSHMGLALALVSLVLLSGFWLWWVMYERTVVQLEQSRIAVLPFTDLSAEATHTSFADGITQELIAQLAQMQGFTVIARTSVMKYKGTQKDVASIGRELRVGTILEGSIRAADNQLRINAQLIDVASQGQVWSQEYDRDLTESFGMQSDIATHLAQGLKMQLMASEQRQADLRAQAQHPSF